MTTALKPPPTLQQVCDLALRLPCSPHLLPRLISAISDPDASADQIAQLIMIDTSLAGATLRLANSAAFGVGSRVSSVAEAVLRLGQRELFRLASLAMVSRWEAGTAGHGNPGDFCRHALCTALAAESLAELTGQIELETAYTAGLICDLGKLAVAHACGAYLPEVYARCAGDTTTWAEAESAVLGYSHSQVGAVLLRTWRFPGVLVAAAEFCERPSQGPEEARPLLAHLHAAKFVATSLGPGVAGDGFLFKLDEALLAEWKFTPEVIEKTIATTHERAHARLQEKLTHGTLEL